MVEELRSLRQAAAREKAAEEAANGIEEAANGKEEAEKAATNDTINEMSVQLR